MRMGRFHRAQMSVARPAGHPTWPNYLGSAKHQVPPHGKTHLAPRVGFQELRRLVAHAEGEGAIELHRYIVGKRRNKLDLDGPPVAAAQPQLLCHRVRSNHVRFSIRNAAKQKGSRLNPSVPCQMLHASSDQCKCCRRQSCRRARFVQCMHGRDLNTRVSQSIRPEYHRDR